MSEWYKKRRQYWKRGDRLPNAQNTEYVNVRVEGGTVRQKRYGCAVCGEGLSRSQATFVIESDRLKTLLTTRFGSLYHYATGSAYPSDNRAWPYCGTCYEHLRDTLFTHGPQVRPESVDGDRYKSAQCGRCEDRYPVEEMTAYVLQPTTGVHQKGGPGMTAASYPRIRGKAIRSLCSVCDDEFTHHWATEQVPSEDSTAESAKQAKLRYVTGKIAEADLERELEEALEHE